MLSPSRSSRWWRPLLRQTRGWDAHAAGMPIGQVEKGRAAAEEGRRYGCAGSWNPCYDGWQERRAATAIGPGSAMISLTFLDHVVL